MEEDHEPVSLLVEVSGRKDPTALAAAISELLHHDYWDGLSWGSKKKAAQFVADLISSDQPT